MASIVAAIVTQDGQLAVMLDDGQTLVAGQVIGPAGPRGQPGRPGIQGPPGADGNTILTLDGAPGMEDGRDGDWAINKREQLLYGPKAASGWGRGNPMTLTPASLDAAMRQFNSRSGPGGGRFFGMGAPSAPGGGGGGGGGTGVGLRPVGSNGNPIPAGVRIPLASDPDGLMVHVLLRCEAAAGCWTGEIVATRFGLLTDHAIGWEINQGTAPGITITTGLTVGNDLEVSMESDTNLTLMTGGWNLI